MSGDVGAGKGGVSRGCGNLVSETQALDRANCEFVLSEPIYPKA